MGLFSTLSQMPNNELAGWGLVITGGFAFICSVTLLLVLTFRP